MAKDSYHPHDIQIQDDVFGPSGEEGRLSEMLRGENEALRYLSPDGYFRIDRVAQQETYSMPRRHQHNFFELYYLLSGTRYYYIQGKTYLLRENDIILVRPGAYHKTIDTSQGSHDRLLIHFDRAYFTQEPSISQFVEELFTLPQIIIRPRSADRTNLQNVVLRILGEMHQPEEDRSRGMMLSGLMREMLALTYRAGLNSNLEAEEADPHSDPRISELIEYINENYRDELRVEALAQRFYLSRYHLSRKFKEATGFTIIEYINSVRIIEAQELLLHSDLKIGELVDQVGFGSSSQFTRIFKDITGVTPSQYRRQQRLRNKGMR